MRFRTFQAFNENFNPVKKCPIYILCESCKTKGIQESDEYDMDTKLSRLTYRKDGPDKVSLIKVCYECNNEFEIDEEYLKSVG